MKRATLAAAASLALLVAPLGAVAQTSGTAPTPKAGIETPHDLFEPFNRAVFGFNTLVVDYFVTPTASFLGTVTPPFMQRIGSNLYENISEPEFVFTNLLAGHPKDAAISVGRFAVNSTVGIVASNRCESLRDGRCQWGASRQNEPERGSEIVLVGSHQPEH